MEIKQIGDWWGEEFVLYIFLFLFVCWTMWMNYTSSQTYLKNIPVPNFYSPILGTINQLLYVCVGKD